MADITKISGKYDFNNDGMPDSLLVEWKEDGSETISDDGKMVYFQTTSYALPIILLDLGEGREIRFPKQSDCVGKGEIGLEFGIADPKIRFFNQARDQSFSVGQRVLKGDGTAAEIKSFLVKFDTIGKPVEPYPLALFSDCSPVALNEIKWVAKNGEKVEVSNVETAAKCYEKPTKTCKEGLKELTQAENWLGELFALAKQKTVKDKIKNGRAGIEKLFQGLALKGRFNIFSDIWASDKNLYEGILSGLAKYLGVKIQELFK